ncbi:hypothetical protein [Chitinophaga flava]|nr:hypothetical protein [Chitinophaga flava]
MYNKIKRLLNTATTSLLVVFLLAMAARVFLIVKTPGKAKDIDISIYMDGGQLVSHGINPYNHQDKVDVRHALRTDSVAYHDYVDADQKRWDDYASSNLPLSLLFYGAIDSFSTANGLLYRLVFVFFDSLLAVLIAQIILKYWKVENTWYRIALIGGLGIFNPVLLHWGAIIPEEKGLQILLMLGAFYFAREKRLLLSAVLLGMSVAFKGLGAFIAPLCLFEILDRGVPFYDKTQIRKGILYVLLSVAACLVWFLPYMPEVFSMMNTRLSTNIDSVPVHSAVWVLGYRLAPDHWELIRKAGLVIFILINLVAAYKKKIGMVMISCSALMLFVDLMLNAGSLDRMNIGFLCVVTIIGTRYPLHGIRIGLIYIILGIVSRLMGKVVPSQAEFMDSLFSLAMVISYTAVLINLFKEQQKNTVHIDETEYSHSRA